MDALNHFDTPTTNRLLRLEYLVGLVVSFYLLFTHLGAVNWWGFAFLFLYIDLIGYIPGAIAYRRSRTQRISKVYYVLYNSMHSLVTQSGVALVWVLLGGPTWSLLALPIHLFGDRALFGNFLKPFGLDFEPVVHPAFAALQKNVESASSSAEGARTGSAADKQPAVS
ncbi:hypothetical protein [Streptomyces afghaniensis]|uniref:hypothetical protein n=1 Tax=Streptomyces afghaniensis TaxID=66865 RepID=UPI002782E270|nr:hypothetical protein [Streptomyces afghaniensis]MDQ1015501.1 hypothetical protein [Streptomyces afghaniensis]